ncbi:MAG: adenylyltransferase/cytidyltransferase family protein [Gemmatimonadota bacterium]
MRGDEAGRRAHPPAERILDRDEVIRRYARPRDLSLVFTNGCFDLLHWGHVSLLYRARALGDLLIVGLNSDRSVRLLKGPGRPLQPVEDRAALLASLRPVDVVTIFDSETPEELIRSLLPDHLVKGADYRREQVVGGDEVEAAGGRVHLLPLEEGRGTRLLIGRASGAGGIEK